MGHQLNGVSLGIGGENTPPSDPGKLFNVVGLVVLIVPVHHRLLFFKGKAQRNVVQRGACSREGALRRLLMQGRIASGVVKQCEDAGVAGKTIGNLKKCYVVAMTAG